SSPLGVGRSLVQCICPVDEDHLGVIGNSVGEIACEKAGIMRPGSWIIIAHQKNQDALYQIRTLAHHNSSESIVNVHLMPYPEAHVAGFSIKHPDDNGDRSTSSALPIVRCPPTVPRWGKFNSASQRCLQLKYPPLLDTFTKSRQSSPSDNATISAAAAPTVSAPDIAPMSIKLDLPLVLPGSYQAGNACVAFYALDALRRYYGYDKLTDAAIQTGFQNTYWPGRLSWLALDRVPLHSPKASAPPPLADDKASVATSRPLAATAGRKPSPSSCSSTGSSRSSYSSSLSGAFSAADRLGTWVLADGAHNRAAATELRNYVDTTLRRYASDNFIYNQASGIFLGSPPVRWIVGFSHGKDMTAILKNLVHPGDILWLVPFSQPSEMPWISCVATDGIYSAAQKLPYFDKIDVVQFDSLTSVLGRLTSDFTDSHLNVLCGSLYLVADLYRELK
ncbi:folylpolyglutamate synthase, partial [Coemansia sp. RSA 2424]